MTKQLADITTFMNLAGGTDAVVQNTNRDTSGRANRLLGMLNRITPNPALKRKIIGLLMAGELGLAGMIVRELQQGKNIPVVDQPAVGIVDPALSYLSTDPSWLKKSRNYVAEKTDGLGRKYADRFVMKGDVSANSNYQAAMKRCQEYLDTGQAKGIEQSVIAGFDAFGRFCANINIDLAPSIAKIKIKRDDSRTRAETRGKRVFTEKHQPQER